MQKNKKYFLFLIIILLGAFSVFIVYQSHNDKKQERQGKIQEKELYQSVSIESEEQEENVVKNYQEKFNNPDIVGELSIENTNLKVPVVKGDDNEYYLHHLLDKSTNELGSIFLDFRNNVTDRKILIYGHNSQDIYTEFHLLENYLNKSYYDEHKYITLKTENDSYQYQIFTVYIAKTKLQHVNLNFSDEEYSNHLKWLKSESLYDTGVEITGNDQILVLQTCYFEIADSYVIIGAKKIN